jgi:hypothetical protein
MAYRVCLQPNGKLALFDTVGQEIVVYDANEKGIVDYMVERGRPEIVERVARMTAKADLTDFQQCVDAMLEVHGAEEVDPILDAMEPETPPSV